METLIEVQDLHKRYIMGNEEVNALDGVSLTIARGEYLAIMGASGSGKSTLMNLIGCLDTPSTGRYWLNHRLVSDLDDDELALSSGKLVRAMAGSVGKLHHLKSPPRHFAPFGGRNPAVDQRQFDVVQDVGAR